MRMALLAGLILGSLGCHTSPPMTRPAEVPYKQNLQGTLAAAALDSAQADSPFYEISDARGLPNLRTVQLPIDMREIRIADQYSMQAGTPSPMLRIVQSPRETKGELLWFWSERVGDPRHLSGRPINCTEAEHSIRTCVALAQFAQPVDWSLVATRLDLLGAWALSQRCENDLSSYSDSGELTIQRLVGRRFDKYACNSPSHRASTGDGRRALAIYEYFLQLVGQAS